MRKVCDLLSSPSSLSSPLKRNRVQVFLHSCVGQVSLLLGLVFFLSKKGGGLGQREKTRPGKKKRFSSSPKPDKHLCHLLPAVEPGDLKGREALAVPRGEGTVARGELFCRCFFF